MESRGFPLTTKHIEWSFARDGDGHQSLKNTWSGIPVLLLILIFVGCIESACSYLFFLHIICIFQAVKFKKKTHIRCQKSIYHNFWSCLLVQARVFLLKVKRSNNSSSTGHISADRPIPCHGSLQIACGLVEHG